MVQFTETMNVYDEFCELKSISTRARYHGRYPTTGEYQSQVLPAFAQIRNEMLKFC